MSDLNPDDPMAPPPNTDGLDLSKLLPQELKLYKLYGRLPLKQLILAGKLKDRKYFDSGDYVMQKQAAKSGHPQDPLLEPVGSNPVNYLRILQMNRNNSIVNGYVKRGEDELPSHPTHLDLEIAEP